MPGRVLIIDDEANIRQMILLTLETAGYEVQGLKMELKPLRSSVATRRGM